MQTTSVQNYLVTLNLEDICVPTYGSIMYFAPVAKTTREDMIATVLGRCRRDASNYYCGNRFPHAQDESLFTLTVEENNSTKVADMVATDALNISVANITLKKGGHKSEKSDMLFPLPRLLGRSGKIQHIYLFSSDDLVDRCVTDADATLFEAPLVTTCSTEPMDADDRPKKKQKTTSDA